MSKEKDNQLKKRSESSLRFVDLLIDIINRNELYFGRNKFIRINDSDSVDIHKEMIGKLRIEIKNLNSKLNKKDSDHIASLKEMRSRLNDVEFARDKLREKLEKLEIELEKERKSLVKKKKRRIE